MALTDALFLDPYPFHNWLARRTDGQAGTGTHADPLSANTPDQFDKLMNGFQSGTVVHLGPGTFYTRGYYDGGAFSSYGWQAKAQTRIVGAGKDVTTLQLVINAASPANAHFYAIGHPFTTSPTGPANPVDFLEISDLTIVKGSVH